MGTLAKSPVRVAREALAVGEESLSLYAHRYSPKKFTQPQLFACLVLKTFFKVDYRGLCVLLRDLSDLRTTLGLRSVPHFTTIQKASQRLLLVPRARRLFQSTVRRFLKRRRRVRRTAFDSTGIDCGWRSAYYVRRRNGADKAFQTVAYSRYGKLEAAIDCDSHLLLAVLVGRGPRVDVDRFIPLLDETLLVVEPESILADAGYDSESNHEYARDGCGIPSFMPATIGRPTTKPPKGRHRRRMKQRLTKNYGGYGQRWQIETGFSMLKRRLGSSIRGQTYWSQCRDLLLLAITYNLMILYATAGFLQSRTHLFFWSSNALARIFVGAAAGAQREFQIESAGRLDLPGRRAEGAAAIDRAAQRLQLVGGLGGQRGRGYLFLASPPSCPLFSWGRQLEKELRPLLSPLTCPHFLICRLHSA